MTADKSGAPPARPDDDDDSDSDKQPRSSGREMPIILGVMGASLALLIILNMC
jgi:hypothetical protein